MKWLWPIAAGTAAGLVAGAIWTWAQPDRFRADARILVRGTEPNRVMPAVEALAESSLVEENVSQTLRLAKPPEVSAAIGRGGVLTVSVEAGSRERARQVDAEAVIILMQKIPQRFGAAPGINTTVLDPAHAAEQTSPTPGRNFLIAGLAGLAAGVAGAIALRRERRVSFPVGTVDPEIERRLRARIDEVAKRERALAKRAGELVARERALEQRAQEQRPPPAAVEPPTPTPPPPPPPPVAVSIAEGRNLNTLEELVRDRTDATPEQQDEWATYLFLLREHAEVDGSLPSTFDQLLNDVFGQLLARESLR